MVRPKKKKKLGGKQRTQSSGMTTTEKRKKIEQYVLTHNVGINEAKRKLHLKGVHPKKRPRRRTKHTVTVYQPGKHEEKKK